MLQFANQAFLFEIETTEQVDPTPTPAANAIACGSISPDYAFQELQRVVVNRGMSEAKKRIGQETVSFDVEIEIKGGGSPSVAPEFAPLIEVAGFTKSAISAKTVAAPEKGFGNSNGPAGLVVTSGGTYTPNVTKRYLVKITTAGASGAAKCSVKCLDDAAVAENTVDNAITTEVAVELGTSGATITFEFDSGELAAGDSWLIYCYVPGTRFRPRASGEAHKSGTAYIYIDGLLWKVNAVRADMVATLEAGELGRLRFSCRGVLGDIVDATMPTGLVYQDNIEPVYIENAGAVINENNALVIPSISFETGNNLQLRKSVNSPKGIKGYRPGKMAPRFGLNLEAELEATHPFYGDTRSRKEFPMNAKVGAVSGNTVEFFARRAAFDQTKPTDNSDLMMYDLGGQLLSTSVETSDNLEIIVR